MKFGRFDPVRILKSECFLLNLIDFVDRLAIFGVNFGFDEVRIFERRSEIVWTGSNSSPCEIFFTKHNRQRLHIVGCKSFQETTLLILSSCQHGF
jgi:hypothetical protein